MDDYLKITTYLPSPPKLKKIKYVLVIQSLLPIGGLGWVFGGRSVSLSVSLSTFVCIVPVYLLRQTSTFVLLFWQVLSTLGFFVCFVVRIRSLTGLQLDKWLD